MTKVSKNQRLTLLALDDYYGQDVLLRYRDLESILGQPRSKVRIFTRALVRKGLAKRTYAQSEDDWPLSGSGHVITDAGHSLASEVRTPNEQ